MIEGPDFHPGPGRVAGQTFGWEAESDVVHILRGFVVLPMARQAVGGEGREATTYIVRVAALAGDLKMCTFQGESGGLVDSKARHIPEGGGRVAGGAVGRQGTAVDVQVASAAKLWRGIGTFEMEVFMARPAGGRCMSPDQGESGDRCMIEERLLLNGAPTLRRVTVEATDPVRKGAMRECGRDLTGKGSSRGQGRSREDPQKNGQEPQGPMHHTPPL
jgi:hypothetical protein